MIGVHVLGMCARVLVIRTVIDPIGVVALTLGATVTSARPVLWLAPRTVTRAAAASRR
jgi:hypothetical protein